MNACGPPQSSGGAARWPACVGVEENAALLVHSVLATTNLEAVKVHVLPAERDLQDPVKPRDARIASYQKAPPDQRADAAQH